MTKGERSAPSDAEKEGKKRAPAPRPRPKGEKGEAGRDMGVEALANAMVTGLPGIERLALHNCKLTNKGLGHLASAIERGALAKCQYLYVQKNDFDVEGKPSPPPCNVR